MTVSFESKLPPIRRGFLVVCLVALGAAACGFLGGEWWAKYEAEKLNQRILLNASGSRSAINLYMMQVVLDELRAGKVKEGEVSLLRFAKLQIQSTRDCQKSAECAFLAGKLMPTEARIAELAAMPDE